MDLVNTPDTATKSVSALIWSNGKILLEDHVKCNAWTLPGGKLNEGESIQDALSRELSEELGITVRECTLFFENTFEVEYPHGSGNYQWFKDYCFSVQTYSGDIQNLEPKKHKELTYYYPEDIGDLKISVLLKGVMSRFSDEVIEDPYEGKITPDMITCSGYLEDVKILKSIAKPKEYQEMLEALDIDFDEIPRLHYIGSDREDIQIDRSSKGIDINVYLCSQSIDKVTVSQYINTAIHIAIVGIIIAKYPKLSGTVFPNAIADWLVASENYFADFIGGLVQKYTMKGMFERINNTDYTQLYKDAKEMGINEIETADDFVTEAKEITAASLTGSLKYRGSIKNKIATGKLKNKASKLADQIKDSIKIDLPKPSTTPSTPAAPEGSKKDTPDDNSVSESMLKSLAEGSYIINGDYVTIIEEDAANDPKLRQILYKERIIKRKDILALLDRVKADIPFIKYAYPDLDRYQGRNLFIDLYYYNQAFFKNNDWKMMKGFNLYKDLLDRLINDKRITVAGYTRRTIFIPINDWHINPSTRMWMYREDLNPISIIYELMMKNPNELKKLFAGKQVVFFGKDKYFTVDFNDTSNMKKIAVKFRTFITKINKGEEFDAEDMDTAAENTPDKEAIKTDIMDKIEVSKGVDLTAASAKDKKEAEDVANSAKNFKQPVPARAVSVPKSKEAVKKTKEEPKEDDPTVSKLTANKPEQAKNDEEIQKAIVRSIDVAATDSMDTDEALDKLDSDEEMRNLILGLDSTKDDSVDLSKARVDRMTELDKELLTQNVKGRSIKDILGDENAEVKSVEIPSTDLNLSSPNEEWHDMKYINFDKTYDMEKDIINSFRHFSNVSRPLSIRNIKVEDHSTSEDRLDLYIVDYEDYRGKRYTIRLDVPKVKNNRFLLRGNAMMLQTQFANMPIVKTDLDTCQIVSNYKKIMCSRFNTTAGKSLPNTARFIKAAKKYTGRKIKFTYGNNELVCAKYILPIDYIDLASTFTTVETPDVIIYFNQDDFRKEYEVNDALGIPYARNKKTNDIIYYGKDITTPFIDVMFGTMMNDVKAYQDFWDLYTEAKPPARGMFSRAKIMGAEIPLVMVCAYHEGLTRVMKKANVQYTLIDKLTSDYRNSLTDDYIRFSDGYLVYHTDYNSSLLMNGLKECDTLSHSITEIDDRNMYLEFLDNYGGRIKADGLDNFYDCEVDPMTEETLKFYDLPTDYVSILLYANRLLGDNSYVKHTDLSARRARRFELVAGYVYQVLSEAYGSYSTGLKHNMGSAAFSCKQSAVIDKIFQDPTSSNYSVINVLNDVESTNAITFKGLNGLNSDRSYSLDKRTYDDSMLGVIGMSTGFSGNVGITRQATMDMALEGNRGYIKDNKGKVDKLNTATALTATESLVPFSTTHDDPMRVAMTFIQTSKHAMRTVESDPLLVTSGSDEAMAYLCSDQFSFKAKGKGKVTELVPDQYMIITYTDGTKDYIDLKEEIEYNADGGFYVPLKLDHDNKLKVGSTVKPGQILAYDKLSFSDSLGESDNIAYNVGTLAKVAIINTDDGYEDSGIITESMAKKLTCSVVYKEDCILDKNTNIYNVAKIGQAVEQGDTLLVWQTPYDEEEVNALLKALANDREAVSELGKRTVKSEVTGKIVDIKIYRTVDIDDLSDSLKKLVKAYEKPISELRKRLDEEGIDDADLPANYPLAPAGKLKKAADGVLIEFYVEYEDTVGVGDKITYYAANKATIKNVIPKGKEPYTLTRKNEEVSALVSVTSVAKRLVTSIVLTGALNKLMVELDRKCKDLAGIPYDDSKV